MRILPLALDGVFLIEPNASADERGCFARVFDARLFAAHGLADCFTQHSVSFNHRKGTLRGLHCQRAPHAETKLVRCTAGAIFDVAVDLRPASTTYGRTVTAELTAANRSALYVPAGCAHGFLTLRDETEVFYEITPDYEAGAAAGILWSDPDLSIPWPFEPTVIGAKDAALPLLKTFAHNAA